MNKSKGNKKGNLSNTLAQDDVVPVVPEDQVQSNGIGNVVEKAQHSEAARD